jgi:hypothetical protein
LEKARPIGVSSPACTCGISNDNDQSGGWMIGAEMCGFFRVCKASRNSSVNSKGAYLANRFVKGLEICEKSLTKHL